MTAVAKVLCGLRGAAYLTPWLLQLLLSDICLSALLPASFFFPTFVYDTSSAIAESVWRGIQAIFTRANGAKITLSGTSLPPGESAIVVANHMSWTDFYMVQELAIKSEMLGRCRWFAKSQLKWVPFLGWGLWAMGMPLVTRNWLKDRAELDSIFGKIVRNQWPIWLISYSEATRFTPEKHAEAVHWCKANDKPLPLHTLHPRTRGFVVTVNQLRQSPRVRAVYDVTLAYARDGKFMATPDMWQTISSPEFGDGWRFHAHVERYDIKDLPSSDVELARWLEDRWVEKGKTLENLRIKLSKGLPWTNQMEGKKA